MADLATAAGYSDASKYCADVLEALAGSGIVALDEKRRRRAEVCISPAWRESLDGRREASGEFAKARMKAVQNRKSREEHRNPTEADPTPELLGPERVKEIFAADAERDHAARVEAQRRKVGITAETFMADHLEGIAGFGWRELGNLRRERGGKREDLGRVVRDPATPYRFVREADGQLYVEKTGGLYVKVPKNDEAARVVPMHPEPSGRADDLRNPTTAAADNLTRPDTRDPRDVFRNTPMHASETNPHTGPGKLPPKGRHRVYGEGVYTHSPECSCWICGDEPAERLEVGATA